MKEFSSVIENLIIVRNLLYLSMLKPQNVDIAIESQWCEYLQVLKMQRKSRIFRSKRIS